MFKKSLYTTLPKLRANECWDLPTQYQVSQGDEDINYFKCMLVNFKIRSLICVAWEYDNDRRYSKRNRVQNKIFYLQFVARQNCLVSSCRIPKKIILTFPCTFHLIPIRIVRLRTNEN